MEHGADHCGHLVEVGMGRYDAARVKEMLEARNREAAGADPPPRRGCICNGEDEIRGGETMSQKQMTTPLWINGDSVTLLQRVPFVDPLRTRIGSRSYCSNIRN